jgi:alkaline phosphatase
MAGLAALAIWSGPRAAEPPPAVILMIGDGMDDHQITIARNYALGADGTLAMETLPYRAAAKVLGIEEADPAMPAYVGDSANSATSLATGAVTSAGRVSTAAGTDEDLPTILEQARGAGLRTGLVTTSALTDATPAAFAAHVADRDCQGPADMSRVECAPDARARGGPGSIAEQMIAAGADLMLGGGAAYFGQRIDPNDSRSPTIIHRARDAGYTVARSLAEAGAAPPGGKVLGLFARRDLPVEWEGEEARPIEIARDGRPRVPAPFRCAANPRFGDTPTLEAMTRLALERLGGDNAKGLFLMVEGASIDKQTHERNPCGHIGELLAFDRAVTAVAAWAATRPRTLLIVTADHGHAAQIIPYPSMFSDYEKLPGIGPQYPAGYVARLRTGEGAVMTINYATNAPPEGVAEEHTGVHVPVFAAGAGAEDIGPLTSQPALHDVMLRRLGR